MRELTIQIDGRQHNVKIERLPTGKVRVHLQGEVFEVDVQSTSKKELTQAISKKSQSSESSIVAPLPGTVFSIHAKPGKNVNKGEKLISLMAMKMENEIVAPRAGRIQTVEVKQHQTVDKGTVLITMK